MDQVLATFLVPEVDGPRVAVADGLSRGSKPKGHLAGARAAGGIRHGQLERGGAGLAGGVGHGLGISSGGDGPTGSRAGDDLPGVVSATGARGEFVARTIG